MKALLGGADISPCGKYRSWLMRETGMPTGTCVFIMLNPSTADAVQDDPTIRRCMAFARRERLGRMIVVNLFTGRATKPRDLWSMDNPEGDDANDALRRAKSCVKHPADSQAWDEERDRVIAAWGAHPGGPEWFRNMYQDRVDTVLSIFDSPPRLRCLGLTSKGAPRHPLYLRADAELIPYPPRRSA